MEKGIKFIVDEESKGAIVFNGDYRYYSVTGHFEGYYKISYWVLSGDKMPYLLYFENITKLMLFVDKYKGRHTSGFWQKVKKKIYPVGDKDVLMSILFDRSFKVSNIK